MSAVVKAVKGVVKGAVDVVKDVADTVLDVGGDVIEAAGDAVSSIGGAVEDAADWVNKAIVQPIVEDPIGFAVQTAGYYFGGPLGAMAATTAVEMSHGESLEDSLQTGAQAGLMAWAGDATTNYFKTGDFSAPIYDTSNVDKVFGSTASTSGSNVVGALDDSQVMANQPINFSDDAVKGFPDFTDPQFTTPAGYDDLVPYDSSDDLLRQMGEKTPYELNAERGINPAAAGPQKPIFDITKGIEESGGYKPYDPGVSTDLPKKNYEFIKPQPGDAAYVPEIIERSAGTPGAAPDLIRVDMDGVPLIDVPNTGLQSAGNLAGAVAEEAGSYIWDGAKWILKNPELALLGGSLLLGALGDKGGPPGGGGDGGKPDVQTKRDEDFNKDLPQLSLNRDPTANPFGGQSTFGRNDNPYESDLYRYAEKQGEHKFFTPTTYTPTTYDSTSMVQAATGGSIGSIGALNSQAPSYYRYGATPMNMAHGGYASGGLSSIRQDGRSDHIPAMLSDGEYVVDAETVALLGNGSNKAGANRLESMRQNVRKQKGGALARGQFSPNARSPLAYLKQRG